MCPARTAALSLLATVAACGPGTTSKECSGVLPGDLVITEVFADAVGPDEGREWLELYNTSDRPIELEGATLTVTKADGSGAKSAQLEGITIAPGQYFTLGNAAPELTPPYIDYGYANALGDMPNSNGGQIALRCGDALIDEAKYDMVKGGHSRQLSAAVPPDYTRNDDLANWCEATESEFSDGAFGTPGQDNDCAPIIAGTCMDGGEMRAAVPPNPGELVITELMPTPRAVSATVGQWVEVMATVPLDLNGVGIDRANDSDMSPETIDAATCVHLEAGEYAVFARNGDVGMNGGVMNIGTFPWSINPNANKDVQLVYGGVVIDSVTWTTSRTGFSLSLNPDTLTATANDDPANFCDSTNVYNTVDDRMDYGTPNAANTECGGVVVGMCNDNGTPRPIVKPAPGQLVISEALANPAGTGTDATQEWFEIANTGGTDFDLNGLSIKGAVSSTATTVVSADCKTVPANGFAVLAHSLDDMINGGLPPVLTTFGFALGTRIEVLDGATSLDVVTLSGNSDGLSRMVRPELLNTVDNDVPDANFCTANASQVYGTAGNAGTPGEANVCL